MRRFKLNNDLTFPLGLLAAPGGAYAAHKAGDTVEIDEKRCVEYDRFIRGRKRAGDLTELSAPTLTAKD